MGAVIQLKAEIAKMMQGDTLAALPDPIAQAKGDLDRELTRLKGSLQPMHPGTKDDDLVTYFTLAGVPDSQQETATAALNDLAAVTAAYVKPEAEPA